MPPPAPTSAPHATRKCFIAFVLALLSAGCIAPMAAIITATPNFVNPLAGRVDMSETTQKVLGVHEQFFVDVGPPEARLSVSVIEPHPELTLNVVSQPKGTVIVLHGVRASSFWMLGTAHSIAEAGYRTVLVDLRGHGRSSGEWLTYGPQEAADVSQVIDALYSRGLVAGELGVYGISYGATAAVHLAGRDRRVNAVVAVAPFDSMRDEVPHYSRIFSLGLGALIPETTYQAAIDRAGIVGGFDPDAAAASDAVRGAAASILILHGQEDWLVPPGNGAAIHAASPERNELALLPGLGHVSIWFDPSGEVSARAIEWFDRHLSQPEQ
ncbi:MAG: hypothetical protein DCC68_02350 [Planctomycetota bacterium]|nr:MAG: hypothetical protein DCC68_02350 [Planctomycetota bacterium]